MGSGNTLIIVKNQRDIFSKFSMLKKSYRISKSISWWITSKYFLWKKKRTIDLFDIFLYFS